jgi:hypothetical protein
VRWAKRSWCAGGVAACLFAVPASADVPTRLVYVRTPEAAACPDQAVLQKAVESRLGHDPFSIWGENTIIATVSAGGGTLRARAELVDGAGVLRGSRDVVGGASDCHELILALSLAISITLDPMQLAVPSAAALEPEEAARDSEPAPAPEQVEPAPVRPRRPVPAAMRRAEPSVWRGYASLFGSIGALPRPSPGARVGLSFQRRGLRAGVEAGGLLPAPEEQREDDRVVISLWEGNIYGCAALSARFLGCVLGSYGVLRGRGEGVSSPRTEMVSRAALGTRVAYELPLGARWSLSAHADLLGTLVRPMFTLNGESAWRPPPVSSELGLSLSLRLL